MKPACPFYQDYLEQLTYLLFLKMADEQTKPPFDGRRFVPQGLDWESLLARMKDPFDGALQFRGDDVRFDDREQIHLVDLEDAIEPFHREHDAAGGRHGAARIAGPRAAHDERHAVLVAQPRDRGHVCGAAGDDDEIGSVRNEKCVSGVRLEALRIVEDVLFA